MSNLINDNTQIGEALALLKCLIILLWPLDPPVGSQALFTRGIVAHEQYR
jgi:hypothetical protein